MGCIYAWIGNYDWLVVFKAQLSPVINADVISDIVALSDPKVQPGYGSQYSGMLWIRWPRGNGQVLYTILNDDSILEKNIRNV